MSARLTLKLNNGMVMPMACLLYTSDAADEL